MLYDRNVSSSTTTSESYLRVICAWPVSGQYGFGTRLIFYIAVVGCFIFRKAEWIRKACLADFVLLFPAAAALHGICLAALHVNGAIDMDIFGAFQLIAVGSFAAPLAIRLSGRYSIKRNVIFLWTALVLSGLISLAVEFYRSNTHGCTLYGTDNALVSANGKGFPYDKNPSCGLVCSTTDGPYSHMRRGSASNIFVVPTPNILTFGTATLLAAACCIPTLLSLFSLYNGILRENWERRFGKSKDLDEETANRDKPSPVDSSKPTNLVIVRFLSSIDVPVFGAIIIALLVLGEINFFSPQVSYQTEPFSSIGQWFPLVCAILPPLVAIHLLLSIDPEALAFQSPSDHHSECSCHHQESNSAVSSLHERSSMESVSITQPARAVESSTPPMSTEHHHEHHLTALVDNCPNTSCHSLTKRWTQ